MSGAGLTLSQVSVSLGATRAVADVSTTLHPGRLVALVGPNGAGKSTLLRAMAGLQRATGTIHWQGQILGDLSPARRARLVGYLPQGHQTHWPLPVRDIVGLGRFAHGTSDPRRLSEADQIIVGKAMQAAGIDHLAERSATQLSGGEKARVALARVLAQQTPLILADEPTASLDPRYQLDVMALLKSMAQNGALVIAVTHDLDHAARFADDVMVLHQGRLVTSGPPDQTLNDGVLRDVFGLRTARQAHPVFAPWEPLP